jgi:RNA polymerase II-associated factor 1
VRDYEVVKVEQEVPNEFLLVFDEGDSTLSTTTNGLNDDETRRAGAYYKMIERKMLLKKKRTEVRCHRIFLLLPQGLDLLITRTLAYRALP